MKYFTKLTALLLVLVLCLSLLPASALAVERSAAAQTEAEDEQEPTVIASGPCGADDDDVTWTLTSDGVLTFSGVGKIRGAVYDQNGDYVPYPWKKYHAQVKKVVVESGITELSDFLCDGYERSSSEYIYPQLEEVEIAGSVKKIGVCAFSCCLALRTVTLNEGLKQIGDSSFGECSSLEKVEIPNSVKIIDEGAFVRCTSLKEVTFLGEPTRIGMSAFNRCTSLKEIVLPSSIRFIARSLLRNCTALERVVIPSTITGIDPRAFYNCTALKEVCYLGTPEQWAKLNIYPGNYHLLRAASYNLPLCYISTNYTNYTYTGKAIKPTVTVWTLNDVTLKKGTNYTVSYENNTDYGTATITITGIGKYSGTTTRTFQIRPAKVQNLRMDRKTTYADLTWKANPDATSYRIYKSGVLQGETRYTRYRLTGLTAKTNRTVTVKAVVKRTNADTGETETFLGFASSVKVTPMQ